MTRPTFTLNIFSNVASPDPRHNMAGHAARSFFEAFAPERSHDVAVRLFVDPNPNPDRLDAWAEPLREAAPNAEVIRTTGLADGFLRSLDLGEGEHAMQLEHDFVFRAGRIGHALEDILATMRAGGVTYLKFNKRWNRALGYDYFMTPQPGIGIPCCRVSGRSNNPHIVDLAYYRTHVARWIDPGARKAEGLEGVICNHVGGGHVYGDLGHPATVGHLDGRRRRVKDALFRRLWLMGAR